VLGDVGFISYPQACRFVEAEAATVFDRDSRVPYAFRNTEWISYDDERSLAYKVCTRTLNFISINMMMSRKLLYEESRTVRSSRFHKGQNLSSHVIIRYSRRTLFFVGG
jgi:hypothetical protein